VARVGDAPVGGNVEIAEEGGRENRPVLRSLVVCGEHDHVDAVGDARQECRRLPRHVVRLQAVELAHPLGPQQAELGECGHAAREADRRLPAVQEHGPVARRAHATAVGRDGRHLLLRERPRGEAPLRGVPVRLRDLGREIERLSRVLRVEDVRVVNHARRAAVGLLLADGAVRQRRERLRSGHQRLKPAVEVVRPPAPGLVEGVRALVERDVHDVAA
jgi:hypothetical protein